jgi:hypothetical protein
MFRAAAKSASRADQTGHSQPARGLPSFEQLHVCCSSP